MKKNGEFIETSLGTVLLRGNEKRFFFGFTSVHI